MDSKYIYKIYPDLKLVVLYYTGDIALSDIEGIMPHLTNEPNYSPKFDTVSDFRGCNLLLNMSNVEYYVENLKSIKKAIDKRKIAFLTNKPNQVALSYLFSSKLKNSPFEAEIFSTSEAAVSYISNPKLNASVLENIITDLKHSI